MMSFKLSVKNIRKSIRDYAIYFLTLILGVAIFYVFNALENQSVMEGITQSRYQMMHLLVDLLGMVSVVVALILGFLICYANNFLIRRRKKEFGVYMMLGMGKGNISRILFGETVLIGLLSLAAGLLIGIFASQFMSILVAKLFEADLTAYTFSVSVTALKRTIFNFGIMYVIVLVFNVFSISRYKLIDLFQAKQKGERQAMKNTGLAVAVFLLAAVMLGYAYYVVGYKTETLTEQKAGLMIAFGCISTFMIFWSLSGFLLKLLKNFKKLYHRNLNAFILRQFSSNVNTAVFSMTVICLLLFVTICAFCSGMSMNNSLKSSLREATPVDLYMEKSMDLPEGYDAGLIENSHKSVAEMLADFGFSESFLQPGYVEISVYRNPAITYRSMLGEYFEEASARFPMIQWETAESIVGVSDYNKLASLYGIQTYDLAEDEYVVVCSFDNMTAIRNHSLTGGTGLVIGDNVLKPKYAECMPGYLEMGAVSTNTGFFLVPDEVIATEGGKTLFRERNLLAGNYAASTEEEKREMEEILMSVTKEQAGKYFRTDGITKITYYESATGLAAIVTFAVLYLGIVFLISSAALLALKALSESTDSKEGYEILRKVGADEKMLHSALFWQIGLFFLLPLLLAMVHSYFGMRFVAYAGMLFDKSDMLSGVGVTALILLFIYGGYFLATYNGSKRIIDES